VVDDPVWLPLEEGAARVYVHRLILDYGLVTLLGVLARCMEEEPAADGLSDAVEVASAADHVQFVPAKEGWRESCVELKMRLSQSKQSGTLHFAGAPFADAIFSIDALKRCFIRYHQKLVHPNGDEVLPDVLFETTSDR
jgi:hypothetical protein